MALRWRKAVAGVSWEVFVDIVCWLRQKPARKQGFDFGVQSPCLRAGL